MVRSSVGAGTASTMAGQFDRRAGFPVAGAGTLLDLNLEEILPCIDAEAFTMMLRPSTPMMPCLFYFGIDLLCGSVIEDPAAVIKAVEQGAVTRQIPSVRRDSLRKSVRSAG